MLDFHWSSSIRICDIKKVAYLSAYFSRQKLTDCQTIKEQVQRICVINTVTEEIRFLANVVLPDCHRNSSNGLYRWWKSFGCSWTSAVHPSDKLHPTIETEAKWSDCCEGCPIQRHLLTGISIPCHPPLDCASECWHREGRRTRAGSQKKTGIKQLML